METRRPGETPEEYVERRSSDPRSTDELIRLALAEEDDEERWGLVASLHYRATREVLVAASALCESGSAIERDLGADILGQLGTPECPFRDGSVELLTGMLAVEPNTDALCSIIVALGHLNATSAVGAICRLKGHPSADLRFAIAWALGAIHDDLARQTLLELMEDEDDDVRDWATFGIGTLDETDTPEIREALARRLDDTFVDAREEAIAGLVHRRDPRAFEPLVRELSRMPSSASCMIEAAGEFADPRLHPLLVAIEKAWKRAKAEDWERQELDEAIEACTPR